jgi:hypothetical protein
VLLNFSIPIFLSSPAIALTQTKKVLLPVVRKLILFPKTREIQKIRRKQNERLSGNHTRTQYLRGSPLRATSQSYNRFHYDGEKYKRLLESKAVN